MTVEEYLSSDLPFYHITPIRKVETILTEGLKNLPNSINQRCGICVVRTDNDEVLNIIAGEQLSGDGDCDFCVFKLIPSKHGITYEFVAPDNILEDTAALYNYINVDCIPVSKDDIFISSFKVRPIDHTGLQDRVVIEQLLHYFR